MLCRVLACRGSRWGLWVVVNLGLPIQTFRRCLPVHTARAAAYRNIDPPTCFGSAALHPGAGVRVRQERVEVHGSGGGPSHSLTHPLTHSPSLPPTHSLSHLPAHFPTRPLTYPPTRSLTHPPAHLPTYPLFRCSCPHSRSLPSSAPSAYGSDARSRVHALGTTENKTHRP